MIQAKIVADSKNQFGDRLTTLEIIIPRFILAEGKTHRIISGMIQQTSIGINDDINLSRNSASSRAIPFKKMVKMVQNNPFTPIAWQKDHNGMQGTEYFTDRGDVDNLKYNWFYGRDQAIKTAIYLNSLGATKQICNRLLEPFMWHKVLISATEWDNFFKLRCPQYKFTLPDDKVIHFKSKKDWIHFNYHGANDINAKKYTIPVTLLDWLEINTSQAEIHIQAAAEAIWDAMNESTPKELQPGEWHLPYGDDIDESKIHTIFNNKYIINKKAIKEIKVKIATARCARLSYQTLGDNPKIDYKADIKLHDKLVYNVPPHSSPSEHIAKAMSRQDYNHWVRGECVNNPISEELIAPVLAEGWCKNFKGFIQYRELLETKQK